MTSSTIRPSIRDVREAAQELKQKVGELPTVTPEEAKQKKAKPITHAFQTRQLDQCQMLLNMLRDFIGVPHLLVRKANSITIWRLPA